MLQDLKFDLEKIKEKKRVLVTHNSQAGVVQRSHSQGQGHNMVKPQYQLKVLDSRNMYTKHEHGTLYQSAGTRKVKSLRPDLHTDVHSQTHSPEDGQSYY